MHSPADLSMLYQETSKRTLSLWRDAPGCGEVMQNDYYQKETFAPVTGIQPPLSDALHALVTAVDALAEGDPLADAMPLHGLHFTFLAIALPRYPRQHYCDYRSSAGGAAGPVAVSRDTRSRQYRRQSDAG